MKLLAHIKQEIIQNMGAKAFQELKIRQKNMVFLDSVTLYEVFIIHDDKAGGLTEQQIYCIQNIIRYAIKTKFPYVRVLVVKSTTNPRNSRHIKIKTKGRPRVIISGEKVAPHVHICAVGNENKSVRDFIYYIISQLRKKGLHSRIETYMDFFEKTNRIDYFHKQADTVNQYGNKGFDFKKCMLDG